jgi:hypothetical protein
MEIADLLEVAPVPSIGMRMARMRSALGLAYDVIGEDCMGKLVTEILVECEIAALDCDVTFDAVRRAAGIDRGISERASQARFARYFREGTPERRGYERAIEVFGLRERGREVFEAWRRVREGEVGALVTEWHYQFRDVTSLSELLECLEARQGGCLWAFMAGVLGCEMKDLVKTLRRLSSGWGRWMRVYVSEDTEFLRLFGWFKGVISRADAALQKRGDAACSSAGLAELKEVGELARGCYAGLLGEYMKHPLSGGEKVASFGAMESQLIVRRCSGVATVRGLGGVKAADMHNDVAALCGCTVCVGEKTMSLDMVAVDDARNPAGRGNLRLPGRLVSVRELPVDGRIQSPAGFVEAVVEVGEGEASVGIGADHGRRAREGAASRGVVVFSSPGEGPRHLGASELVWWERGLSERGAWGLGVLVVCGGGLVAGGVVPEGGRLGLVVGSVGAQVSTAEVVECSCSEEGVYSCSFRASEFATRWVRTVATGGSLSVREAVYCLGASGLADFHGSTAVGGFVLSDWFRPPEDWDISWVTPFDFVLKPIRYLAYLRDGAIPPFEAFAAVVEFLLTYAEDEAGREGAGAGRGEAGWRASAGDARIGNHPSEELFFQCVCGMLRSPEGEQGDMRRWERGGRGRIAERGCAAGAGSSFAHAWKALCDLGYGQTLAFERAYEELLAHWPDEEIAAAVRAAGSLLR